jgi:type I restriction enzyme R subunit
LHQIKDNNHTVADGMQQSLEYAKILEAPSVCSSNGDGFLEHDEIIISGPIEKELKQRLKPTLKKIKNVEFSGTIY